MSTRCLLDMYGTLVDSDAAVERAWAIWASEYGVSLDAVDLDDIARIPGTDELLATVADLGLPWAVVTSADRRLAAARLRATGLEPPVLVTFEDVAVGKPDPGGLPRRGPVPPRTPEPLPGRRGQPGGPRRRAP